MAIENTIKRQIDLHLRNKGWVMWFVHRKARFVRGKGMIQGLCDIYGIWDALAMKGDELKAIQFTSKANMSARLRKIHKFYEENELSYPCEIWGYAGSNNWHIWKYNGDKKTVIKSIYNTDHAGV